jgi:hypothetical protein
MMPPPGHAVGAAGAEVDADGVEILRTSHGVVPSQWIRRLPCLIRAFVMLAYCELLRPHDDFRQQLRKIVLLFGPLCSGVLVLVLAVNVATLGHEWGFAAIAARFVALHLLAVCWVTYFVCRVTGRVTALTADLWLLGAWLGLVIVAMTFHDFPIDHSFIMLLVVSMLFRTPRLPMHALLNYVSLGVAFYNNAAYSRGAPDVVLLADPGALMRGVGIRMFSAALMYGALAVVFGGLQLQLLESDRQTEQATANGDVAAELASHLGDYNTRRAEEVVARAIAECTADPKLLEGFRVLIGNLDRYRPHLPNWMLPSAADDEGAGAVESDTDSIRFVEINTQSDHRPGSGTSSARRCAPPSPHAHAVGPPSPHAGHLVPNVAQTAASVLAHAHFTFRADDPTTSSPPRRIADATCALADRVHQLARSTGGAVHSFVGDLVVVSWNAASRVVQPEMKAVRFLLRLREDTGDAGIAVGGAAFAGQTRVQLAGSAGAQAALTVHARWYEALGTLAALGRSLGTFVIDGTFKTQVEFGAVARPAAAVCVDDWRDTAASIASHSLNYSGRQQPPPPRVLVAHEVVSEVAEGDDEWMYVLDKATSPDPAATDRGRGDGSSTPEEMHRQSSGIALRVAAVCSRPLEEPANGAVSLGEPPHQQHRGDGDDTAALLRSVIGDALDRCRRRRAAAAATTIDPALLPGSMLPVNNEGAALAKNMPNSPSAAAENQQFARIARCLEQTQSALDAFEAQATHIAAA